jgi:hypothetical protein
VAPIRNSLIASSATKEAIEPRVPLGNVEVITIILRSPLWLCWPIWNSCVTNDHGYVPLVVNTSWFFPHSRLIIGFVTSLTRRVPLVEQKLLTLRSSPPVFSGVRVTWSCRSLFVVLLHSIFWPMCVQFFDIRNLITPLVSSNSYRKHELLTLREHLEFTPEFLCCLLYVFTVSIPCCDVRYDFCIRCSVRLFLLLFVRGHMSCLR